MDGWIQCGQYQVGMTLVIIGMLRRRIKGLVQNTMNVVLCLCTLFDAYPPAYLSADKGSPADHDHGCTFSPHDQLYPIPKLAPCSAPLRVEVEVIVLILGLSYGARNVLSCTMCMNGMLQNFLAFRDRPIIPRRSLE